MTRQTVFRSHHPLSDAQIWDYAPSIMADSPHASTSERYTHISTRDVLDGLRREGFAPYEVRQTIVRDPSRRNTTKHLMRLRHADQIGQRGEVPEIVLVNSHDGTSSYQIMAGFFRIVCSNGLIAGSLTDDVRVRHSGNVVDNVIEGSYSVLENLGSLESRIDQYRSIHLDHPEQIALATAAVQVRWGDDAPVVPASLLRINRWEDDRSDLWTVFNRLQENVIRGGVRGRAQTGRRMSTRAVTGVSESVRVNRALWTLADEMAKLKEAA